MLIAYDRDDAGEKAAASLADELIAMGIDCYRVLFPKGMDANQYACEVKPKAKSLGVMLNSAKWIGKGKPPAVVSVPDPPPPSPPEPAPATKEEKADPVTSLAAEPVAVPAPQSSTIDIPVEIKGDEIVFHQGDRRYRVRGLGKNMSHELLKVNVLVGKGDAFHVDTLDLYSARQRAIFTKQAADELGVKSVVYIYDVGGNLMMEQGESIVTAGTQYLLADHLGSTRMVLGSDGTCLHRIDYLPFGGESPRTEPCYGGDPPTNPSNVSLKFTGKERDAETGLDYFGARYYSGWQGRFSSPDIPYIPKTQKAGVFTVMFVTTH